MKRSVGINAIGRRVGESHHNAKLTDHDVDLIREFLDERERFTKEMTAAGYGQEQIRHAVAWQKLDIRSIAAKFEVAPSTVQSIHTCQRRGQIPVKFKTIEDPD